MTDQLRYPKLQVEDRGVLAHATAFTTGGGAVEGHLAVDKEGHVVFVESGGRPT